VPRPGQNLPEATRRELPRHFEPVADALVADGDLGAACTEVGRDAARDGASLGEALSGLRSTYRLVTGGTPGFEAGEALSVAWSEATLEHLHQISCEDPLTGLTSLAHVRTRLAELYRESELTDVSVQRSHALVIVELRFRSGSLAPADRVFTRALRLVQVAEALRAVYSGGQTIGRLGMERAVAVVPRTVDLGVSVALLRDFLGDLDLGGADTRVWIEGLPAAAESATRLLDDLAR
jgi:GGDEF domain-containing protein